MNFFPILIVAIATIFIGHLIATHSQHVRSMRIENNTKRCIEENRSLNEKTRSSHESRDVGKAGPS